MRGPSFLSFWILSNLLLVPSAMAAYVAEPEPTIELIDIGRSGCGFIFLEDLEATCPDGRVCDTGDVLGLLEADREALGEAGRSCRARPRAQVALEIREGRLDRLVLLDEQATEIEACMHEALSERAFDSPTRLAVGAVYAR